VLLTAHCRVEFDAYRSDLEALQSAPRVGDPAAAQKLEDAQQRYTEHRDKFERLRSDVSIKMKFLDENRVGRTFFYSFFLLFVPEHNVSNWCTTKHNSLAAVTHGLMGLIELSLSISQN